MKQILKTTLLTTIVSSAMFIATAQDKKYPEPGAMKADMTEFWLPQPTIVTPGDMETMIAPPSDAIVLFGGGNLNAWQSAKGGPATWDVVGDVFKVKAGSGDITTKESFGDCQLHIEWREPADVSGESQGRGNSGVYIQERYEVQILDSYNNETYANGQAGSIYKQYPPLVNATNRPGRWNVYDIIFTAPRFKADGSLQSHATVTVLHNGVVVQNHAMILGPTEYIGIPKYKSHGDAPIVLQDHGNPVNFRNIWVRKL